MNDISLLREYAKAQSEPAFAELVHRYVNLVYSAAVRQLGNPHAAEEVTQAVFIVLAHKAGQLSENTVLSGWLLKATHFAANSQLRQEIRRTRREQEAYMQSMLNQDDAAAWDQLAPVLDQAMASLCDADRNALVLRFFENKTAQEISAALNINEEAAQKRVSRALEKLRKILKKRQLALATTAISGALSANAIQAAPLGLEATVATSTLNGVAVAGTITTLVNSIMNTLSWFKLKLALGIGAAVILGVAVVVIASQSSSTPQRLSQSLYRMQGTLSWSAGTNTWLSSVEILRNGDILKIISTQAGSNYFASGFISTSNTAVNFSQYEKDITGVQRTSKSWNNGSVTLSYYRMPLDAQLASIWLPLAGREDASMKDARPRVPFFPDGGREFHERPHISPIVGYDPGWGTGYSDYSETTTNTEAEVVHITSLKIAGWTNCNGIKFPALLAGTRTATAIGTDVEPQYLMPVNFKFEVTRIGEPDSTVDTRIPFRSSVTDWRPREDGRLETGCNYSITNGVLFADILQAAKAGEVSYNQAFDATQSRGLPRKTLAPDFTGNTLEGTPLKLSDFRGKLVLLCFWSTTCGPCIGEVPKLKEIYDACGKDPRFAMIGLALDDNARQVEAFVEKNKMQWPQIPLHDEFSDAICKSYKIRGIPTGYLIGPDGKIMGQFGRVDKGYISALLDKLAKK